jgi:hypothetical protein
LAGELLGKIYLQFEWIRIALAVCIHSSCPTRGIPYWNLELKLV